MNAEQRRQKRRVSVLVAHLHPSPTFPSRTHTNLSHPSEISSFVPSPGIWNECDDVIDIADFDCDGYVIAHRLLSSDDVERMRVLAVPLPSRWSSSFSSSVESSLSRRAFHGVVPRDACGKGMAQDFRSWMHSSSPSRRRDEVGGIGHAHRWTCVPTFSRCRSSSKEASSFRMGVGTEIHQRVSVSAQREMYDIQEYDKKIKNMRIDSDVDEQSEQELDGGSGHARECAVEPSDWLDFARSADSLEIDSGFGESAFCEEVMLHPRLCAWVQPLSLWARERAVVIVATEYLTAQNQQCLFLVPLETWTECKENSSRREWGREGVLASSSPVPDPEEETSTSFGDLDECPPTFDPSTSIGCELIELKPGDVLLFDSRKFRLVRRQ